MEEKKPAPTYRLGQRVTATVEQVFPFGVFCRVPDGSEAYVRRRELSQDGTLLPADVVAVGQVVEAVVVTLPEPGRKLELSFCDAEPDPWGAFARSHNVQDSVTATVKNLSAQGVWVQIVPGVDAFVPSDELAPWPVQEPGEMLWPGDLVQAMIMGLDRAGRRVRLSIRRQVVHEAQVQRITAQLRTDEPPPDPERDEPETVVQEPTRLEGLGRVLVVDDDAGVRIGLVEWVQRHGGRADGVATPEEGLSRVREAEYGLAIVDLDLGGHDGLELVRALRQAQPDLSAIVTSIPDWIAERSDELEDAAVVDVFTKPLDLDDVADVLIKLAHGVRIGPYHVGTAAGAQETRTAFGQLDQILRSGTPLEARLEAALRQLVALTRAELGVVFHLDRVSQQVTVAARAGHLAIRQEAIYGLTQSPVKDLIIDGREAFETRITPQARPRFEKLLNAVDFQSCVGVPVTALGRVDHALFLFHREPDAFSQYRVRDARATALLLGVALESQALEERVHTISPFLVGGQLAAGFGHDVFNKMTGLELRVRNVKAATADLPASGAQLAQDADQLLDTTLDLRRTVEAFQELIRADTHVSLDVNQVANRSALLLRAIAQRSRVHIETALEPNLPLVAGSPVRLQQAFLNVMLNAIQHTAAKRERWPQGESRLRITTSLEPGSVRPVCVRFGDSGPGIHRQQWDRIFALGYSTRAGGSGLGLFIARSLVDSMGGRIVVEKSAIPMGTTFLIELPSAASAASAVRREE